MDWFFAQNPIFLAFLATLFTWGVTALGAATVFCFKSINQRLLNVMLGFAAGVMIAASFWSLLAPAIEMASALPSPAWLVAVIGFLGGTVFLWASDKLLPHTQFWANKEGDERSDRFRRNFLLIFAITLHNIPEGLAVGVAFGLAAQNASPTVLLSAAALAFGIGLQNFPEGAAVSLPLRRAGLSRAKCFFYGQASGLVEPIAGVLGALLVTAVRPVLPYALAFAAGAMIYVVVEELIPEAQLGRHADKYSLATLGCIFGFSIMMVLDVALG